MDKNWLIRTSQHKILGPISKAKLIEFIEKGSLTQTDEVCSGNGFWFYLHEQDLVDRHIVGDEPQGFNPISEGKTVLARKRRTEDTNTRPAADAETNHTMVIGQDLLGQLNHKAHPQTDKAGLPLEQDRRKVKESAPIMPKAEDLEFPDIDTDIELPSIEFETADISQNVSHSTEILASAGLKHEENEEVDVESDEQFQGKLPSADDLEFPAIDGLSLSVSSSVEKDSSQQSEKKKSRIAPTPPVKPLRQKSEHVAYKNRQRVEQVKVVDSKNSRNDRYLFLVFFVMISLVVYAVYFYYSKISSHQKSSVGDELSSLFIPSVYAQEVEQKKNSLFLPLALPYAQIALGVTTSGISLEYLFSAAAKDQCPFSNDYHYLFYLLSTSDRAQIRNNVQSYPNCKISPKARQMIDIFSSSLSVRREWGKQNEQDLSDDDKRVLKKVRDYQARSQHISLVVEQFNQYIEFLGKSPTAAQLHRMNEKIVNFGRHHSSRSILLELLNVLVALSVDNQPWAKSSFSQILQRNLLQIAFMLDDVTVFSTKEQQERYAHNMRRAMVYIVDHLEDKTMAQLAINYYAIFDQSEVTTRLIEKSDASWSFVKIKKMIEKPIQGRFFFIPWFYILQARAPSQDVEAYIDQFLTVELVQQLQLELMPIIASSFPRKSEVREAIVKMVIQNFDTKSPFYRLQLIEALKIPYIADRIKERPAGLRGATFQLERAFYNELLMNYGITRFSLFNLLRLGEENQALLWWLVL